MPAPRLLLIDDSPEVALLARHLARRAGQGLVVAVSAEAALDILAADRAFDLLLLDVNLPGMDGVTLAGRLLAEGVRPVAIFQQSGLHDDLARAVDAGVAYVFFKDYLADPARWAGRCDEILRAAGGESAARPLSCPEAALGPALEQALGSPGTARLAAAVLARCRHGSSLLDVCGRLFGGAVTQRLEQALRPHRQEGTDEAHGA